MRRISSIYKIIHHFKKEKIPWHHRLLCHWKGHVSKDKRSLFPSFLWETYDLLKWYLWTHRIPIFPTMFLPMFLPSYLSLTFQQKEKDFCCNGKMSPKERKQQSKKGPFLERYIYLWSIESEMHSLLANVFSDILDLNANSFLQTNNANSMEEWLYF